MHLNSNDAQYASAESANEVLAREDDFCKNSPILQDILELVDFKDGIISLGMPTSAEIVDRWWYGPNRRRRVELRLDMDTLKLVWTRSLRGGMIKTKALALLHVAKIVPALEAPAFWKGFTATERATAFHIETSQAPDSTIIHSGPPFLSTFRLRRRPPRLRRQPPRLLFRNMHSRKVRLSYMSLGSASYLRSLSQTALSLEQNRVACATPHAKPHSQPTDSSKNVLLKFRFIPPHLILKGRNFPREAQENLYYFRFILSGQLSDFHKCLRALIYARSKAVVKRRNARTVRDVLLEPMWRRADSYCSGSVQLIEMINLVRGLNIKCDTGYVAMLFANLSSVDASAGLGIDEFQLFLARLLTEKQLVDIFHGLLELASNELSKTPSTVHSKPLVLSRESFDGFLMRSGVSYEEINSIAAAIFKDINPPFVIELNNSISSTPLLSRHGTSIAPQSDVRQFGLTVYGFCQFFFDERLNSIVDYGKLQKKQAVDNRLADYWVRTAAVPFDVQTHLNSVEQANPAQITVVQSIVNEVLSRVCKNWEKDFTITEERLRQFALLAMVENYRAFYWQITFADSTAYVQSQDGVLILVIAAAETLKKVAFRQNSQAVIVFVKFHSNSPYIKSFMMKLQSYFAGYLPSLHNSHRSLSETKLCDLDNRIIVVLLTSQHHSKIITPPSNDRLGRTLEEGEVVDELFATGCSGDLTKMYSATILNTESTTLPEDCDHLKFKLPPTNEEVSLVDHSSHDGDLAHGISICHAGAILNLVGTSLAEPTIVSCVDISTGAFYESLVKLKQRHLPAMTSTVRENVEPFSFRPREQVIRGNTSRTFYSQRANSILFSVAINNGGGASVSSNPVIAWAAGLQCVAVDHRQQNIDVALLLNETLFSMNAKRGYVLKPASLQRSSFTFRDPAPLIDLSFHVICARQIPRTFSSGSELEQLNLTIAIDFYGAFGNDAGCRVARHTTETVRTDGLMVSFNRQPRYEFHNVDLEVSFVAFHVLNTDRLGTRLIASSAISVASMKWGYRWVPLRGSYGDAPGAGLVVLSEQKTANSSQRDDDSA